MGSIIVVVLVTIIAVVLVEATSAVPQKGKGNCVTQGQELFAAKGPSL